MKERSIRLRPHEVRAIRAGRQTQFRREIKWPLMSESDGSKKRILIQDDVAILQRFLAGPMKHPHERYFPCGGPGSKLWVKESFQLDEVWNDCAVKNVPNDEVIFYPADESSTGVVPFGWGRVRSSIHMPRWASRLTLEVVNVRVERLQEISDLDALAEGVMSRKVSTGDARLPLQTVYGTGTETDWASTAQDAFEHLWESINGPGSWERNPFVRVVEFKKI